MSLHGICGPRCAALLVVIALSGCAGHRLTQMDSAQVDQFTRHGYSSANHYDVSTQFTAWESPLGRFDIAATTPSAPGRLPLVIYLPALGEDRSSGEALRTAWAASGYAVLALQPLSQDALRWTDPGSRPGDPTPWARERYAAPVMAARIHALRTVLLELVRRQAAREAPLDRFDLERVALAGQDLGAYTAMVAAGEAVLDATPPPLPLRVSATLALSPHADFSGVPLSERYSAIQGPVLSTTSDNDLDPLGLVGSPSLRRAPFEYMPPKDKFLLIFADISHATLAGTPAPRSPLAEAARDKSAGGGTHRKLNPVGPTGARTPQVSPTRSAMAVVALQKVSLAFLDAYLRQDPIAAEWLERDASRWLGEGAQLRRR